MPVLKSYCKSWQAQVDGLYAFEKFCNESRVEFLDVAVKVVELLYDTDVLSEDAIMSWFKDSEKRLPDFGPTMRKSVMPFIKWLEQAESEDSSDDETS